MITDVIDRYLQGYTVNRLESQDDTSTVLAGTISSQDIEIFQINGDLGERDRVNYKNKVYEIRESSYREVLGCYAFYVARRLNDSNS